MGCARARPAQRGGNYPRLASLDHVHQPALLFNTGVLRLTAYRAAAEMD